MINTYSVIIQTERTIESFSQYQTLFAEAMNSGKIGVCKWNESGTSVDTALPELRGMTDDKDEWRAIIVRHYDDRSMATFEYDPSNPYDFYANRSFNGEIEESNIPIIRLTHLLGGLPPYEVRFEARVEKEEHMAPKTVYIPVEDEERENRHNALARKYRFDGKPPSVIMIITIRNRSEMPESIGGAWLSHKESESSEFWKRNQYPSICRFMVYDYEAQGPLQREADDFKFWLSVMLLAINPVDPATLQAYRLYTVNPIIDKERMAETFQVTSNRLRDASQTLDYQIRRDLEEEICEEEPLPDYHLDIPVSLKMSKNEDYEFDVKEYGLLSRGLLKETSAWNRHHREVEEKWSAAVRSSERVLDHVADRMRERIAYEEAEVDALNRYQEEDLLRETGILYNKVVSIQGTLPTESIEKSNSQVENAENDVRKLLIGRVPHSPAVAMAGALAILCVLSGIPTIIRIIGGINQDVIYFLIIMITLLLLSGLFGFISLFLQRWRLRSAIGIYNQRVSEAFNKLVDNADDYSEYMSAIASHARGFSYLNLSNRKKHYKTGEHQSRYLHLKALNVMLSKMKLWSNAFHLNTDFDSKRSDIRINIDANVPPERNSVYWLESGGTYPIGLNNSGMKMESPLPFIDRFEILREELYDDERL